MFGGCHFLLRFIFDSHDGPNADSRSCCATETRSDARPTKPQNMQLCSLHEEDNMYVLLSLDYHERCHSLMDDIGFGRGTYAFGEGGDQFN